MDRTDAQEGSGPAEGAPQRKEYHPPMVTSINVNRITAGKTTTTVIETTRGPGEFGGPS